MASQPGAATQDWRPSSPPADFSSAAIPLIRTEAIDACPVCERGGFDQWALGFDYELLTCRNPWRMVRCQDCRHVWLNPRPARDALGVIYPPSYYAYNYETQISPIAVRGKALLDALKLGSILGRLGRRPTCYLDVGCGTGRFLTAMEKRGLAAARIQGIELDAAATRGVAGRGYRIHIGPVEDCDAIAEASLDLVTMFHVIEHVADPGAVARKIHGWLAPGGVLAVETPNCDSLDARLFQSGFWGGYHIPRHWNVFTPASLERLLRSAGFELVGTLYQTGHSFWMYSFHHALKYGARPRRGLARWFDPFRSLPLLLLFTAFDRLRAILGFRTSAMLLLARKASTPLP